LNVDEVLYLEHGTVLEQGNQTTQFQAHGHYWTF
jgi:ABC-type multidrug transport system fused ATPase/permease subunit